MSIIQRAINGLDVDSELPPISGNANKYLKVNNNGNDVEWSLLSQSVSLPDGTEANPAQYFANDPDTGIYRIGANNIGLSCNATLEMSISDTQTIIKNDLLLNNNGFFFESDTDTGIRRANPNQIAIRTNGTDKINVGDIITSFSNTCNFTRVIKESNVYVNLLNASPTLTISTARQYRCISVEISALTSVDGLVDFDVDISDGEFYLLQVYNNSGNSGRVCNVRFNNSCWNLMTMSTITSNTNIQIHSQNPNQSYSCWLIFRHAGDNLHLQRLDGKNQDLQTESLSLNTPITYKSFTVSSNYIIPLNDNYNFYNCEAGAGAITITLPNYNSDIHNGRQIYIQKSTFTVNLVTVLVPSGHTLGDITDGTFQINRGGSVFMCVYNRVATSNRWTIIKLGAPGTVQTNDIQFSFNYIADTTTPTVSFRGSNAAGTNHNKSGMSLHTDETSLNLITNNVSRLRIGATETEVLNTRLVLPAGSAGAPSIVFANDVNDNSGFFATADNQINVSCNGTNVLQINQTNLDAKVPVQFSGSSSVSSPAFYNGGSSTTGLFFESNLNNDVSIACAGTLCLQVTNDFIADNLNHFKMNKAPVNVLISENTDKTWTWSEMLTRFPLYIFDTSGGLRTLTLPAQTSNTTYIGLTIKIYKVGANNLDIKGNAGVYLNGTIAGTHTITANRQLHHIVYTGDTSNSALGWHVLS